MHFKGGDRGVFGAICAVKCILEGNHAAALCLHCVLDGYDDCVVLDERGKVVAPAKTSSSVVQRHTFSYKTRHAALRLRQAVLKDKT